MKYCWIVFDGDESPICVCRTKKEALCQLEKLICEVRVHKSVMDADIQHINRLYKDGFDNINAGSQYMIKIPYIENGEV
jgi:hypothetical protein